MKVFSLKTAMLAVCILGAGSIASAQQPPGGQQGQRWEHHGPPPQAIAACANLTEGASCSFTGHRGDQVAGICRTHEQGEPLACHPPHIGHPPHGEQGGPPPNGTQGSQGIQQWRPPQQ